VLPISKQRRKLVTHEHLYTYLMTKLRVNMFSRKLSTAIKFSKAFTKILHASKTKKKQEHQFLTRTRL